VWLLRRDEPRNTDLLCRKTRVARWTAHTRATGVRHRPNSQPRATVVAMTAWGVEGQGEGVHAVRVCGAGARGAWRSRSPPSWAAVDPSECAVCGCWAPKRNQQRIPASSSWGAGSLTRAAHLRRGLEARARRQQQLQSAHLARVRRGVQGRPAALHRRHTKRGGRSVRAELRRGVRAKPQRCGHAAKRPTLLHPGRPTPTPVRTSSGLPRDSSSASSSAWPPLAAKCCAVQPSAARREGPGIASGSCERRTRRLVCWAAGPGGPTVPPPSPQAASSPASPEPRPHPARGAQRHAHPQKLLYGARVARRRRRVQRSWALLTSGRSWALLTSGRG
jgi:hypothetical protein